MSGARRPASCDLLPLLLLGAVQLAVISVVRHTGPLAISDDDYARVVIAQEFAAAPRLDPSGTSWLPLPFYVTGTAMAVFGATLEVARATQVALALASAALLYCGARHLGHSRWFAALAAALAATLPSAARLSPATIPEYPTAACLAFGMLCLVRPPTVLTTGRGASEVASDANARHRGRLLAAQGWPALGAIALYFACASRYEAWPVAGVYAGITCWRALRTPGTSPASPPMPSRQERSSLFLAAAIASAFPLLWLLHGVVRHGDALFFVTRVTHYKAALGGPAQDAWAPWLGYPLALVTQERGATLLLGTAVLLALAKKEGRATLLALGPLFAALAALVLVLVLGDVRGGAPTHHPERALLSLWLLTPALALHLLLLHVRTVRAHIPALLALALSATVWNRVPPGAFAVRFEEERLGRRLRTTAGEIVVLTPDYGYLALQAAAGRPARFVVVDRNDPRDARQPGPAAERARLLLAETRAPWAVLPLGVVVPGYRMIEHGSRLALLASESGDIGVAALGDKTR